MKYELSSRLLKTLLVIEERTTLIHVFVKLIKQNKIREEN